MNAASSLSGGACAEAATAPRAKTAGRRSTAGTWARHRAPCRGASLPRCQAARQLEQTECWPPAGTLAALCGVELGTEHMLNGACSEMRA
eukprot:6181717-Pleurochrysis_carterae.AAC.8